MTAAARLAALDSLPAKELCQMVEAALAARGLGASAIASLRVAVRPPADATDLADLVAEWLDGTPVPVELVEVARLTPPGTLVELRARLVTTHSDPDPKDRP